MPDATTAAELIEQRLRAGWTATPAARLRFENDPYLDVSQLAPFCQVEIVGGRDVPYIGAPGARLNRLEGAVMLHLMQPVGTGRAAITTMFRNARALLGNAIFSGVYMQGLAPTGARPGSEDGAYFGVTAMAPFFYLYADA